MSHLFTDLSDEQQELVAGGGPTLGAVLDIARFTQNASPVYSTATATPAGANSTGFALPTETDSTAAQLAFGASGNPTTNIPSFGLSLPSY